MLGLESGRVALGRSHALWRAEFARANRVLTSVPCAVAIEHVGSTAVPELVAKPIIDIALAVETRRDVDQAARELTRLGYRDRGERPDAGGRIADYVREHGTTRHVHIVLRSSEQWLRYLRFRDCLIADRHLREVYASLKHALAARFSTDRRAYTAAKRDFIELLTDAIPVTSSTCGGIAERSAQLRALADALLCATIAGVLKR